MAKTQPGGVYKVGGQLVDANGKDVSDSRPKPNLFSDAFDVDTAAKDELKAEAERRGLTITRADGKPGEPLVEDYQKALR